MLNKLLIVNLGFNEKKLEKFEFNSFLDLNYISKPHAEQF